MKSLKYICLMGSLIAAAGFTSCADEEDDYFDSGIQGKQISVTKIYLEDYESSVPDRPVDFARVGQLIRIEGSGLYGMKKVYINGFDTYFNRAYVSDNSMLVNISADTPISDADPEVRDKIRLVKDKAECTYEFVIRAASPSVKSMKNTMPMPGESVVIYGANLQEISKVTLPGGMVVTEGIVSDNEEGEWFYFTMPEGVAEGGSIYFEGANGQGATPGYFNFKAGLIFNFDGIGAQGAWGGKDDDGNIKKGASMVYPEDLVEDPANSGRGSCAPLVPQRLLDEGGVSSGKPRATECWTAGAGEPTDDWSRFFSAIPAETSCNDVAFQFDVYCPEAWSGTGHIQVSLYNNFNFGGIGSDDDSYSNACAFVVPWIQDGKVVPFQTDGWQTITIPFSNIMAEETKPSALGVFGSFFELTFQDVVDKRKAATYPNFGMGFVNTDFTLLGNEVVSTAFTGPAIFTDNWRVVPCKSVSISDYPDDEE